jgi:VTC domain
LRHRADVKFVVHPAAAAAVLPPLAGDYAVLAAGEALVASYRTLYFDTAALDFFHDQRRGKRVRHKVRIRHYPDRSVTLLEVKTRRNDLETAKVWREHGYGDSAMSAADQTFVEAHTATSRSLDPQVWTSFHRVTLLGLRTNERVTIDFDLEVSMGERRRVLPLIAIVEVKQWPVSRSTPVMSALRAAGWRPAWASKYCAAIALTRPDVRLNTLLPGLRGLERRAG